METQRTFSALAKQFGKTPENFGIFARKHNWIARAEAYDRSAAQQEEKRFAEIRVQAEKTRSERELRRRDLIWATCERLLEAIQVMIARAAATGAWSGAEIARACDCLLRLSGAAVAPFTFTASAEQPRIALAGSFQLYPPDVAPREAENDGERAWAETEEKAEQPMLVAGSVCTARRASVRTAALS